MIYDIVVIGGGPAGSVFSKFINSKYKVLLLDRRDYEDENNKIIKCCGGLLAHEAQAALSGLGYSLSKDILVSPQVFNVQVIDYDNNLKKKYYKNYLNFDREKFDNYLLSQKASHVELIKGALFIDYSEDENGIYTVIYRIGTDIKKVKTKMIVSAEGANSLIRKNLDSKSKNDCIAIQRVYKMKKDFSYHMAIFDKNINNYYSWLVPKGNELILGTILKKGKGSWDKFHQLEERVKSEGIDINDIIRDEGTFIRVPKWNEYFMAKDRIALIGEAAGLISASSSEGISYALISGYYLADSINKKGIKSGIIDYCKRTESIRMKLNLKILKGKLMYNSFIRKFIIMSGVFSNKDYIK